MCSPRGFAAALGSAPSRTDRRHSRGPAHVAGLGPGVGHASPLTVEGLQIGRQCPHHGDAAYTAITLAFALGVGTAAAGVAVAA